jgi:hypothetical protein
MFPIDTIPDRTSKPPWCLTVSIPQMTMPPPLFENPDSRRGLPRRSPVGVVVEGVTGLTRWCPPTPTGEEGRVIPSTADLATLPECPHCIVVRVVDVGQWVPPCVSRGTRGNRARGRGFRPRRGLVARVAPWWLDDGPKSRHRLIVEDSAFEAADQGGDHWKLEIRV